MPLQFSTVSEQKICFLISYDSWKCIRDTPGMHSKGTSLALNSQWNGGNYVAPGGLGFLLIRRLLSLLRPVEPPQISTDAKENKASQLRGEVALLLLNRAFSERRSEKWKPMLDWSTWGFQAGVNRSGTIWPTRIQSRPVQEEIINQRQSHIAVIKPIIL